MNVNDYLQYLEFYSTPKFIRVNSIYELYESKDLLIDKVYLVWVFNNMSSPGRAFQFVKHYDYTILVDHHFFKLNGLIEFKGIAPCLKLERFL